MRRAQPLGPPRLLSIRRTASLLALLTLTLQGTLTLLATPASAEEVFDRPADGVFAVEGHGWGHGRGMSQWGAQGAASLGVDAETIVRTYYPGTTRAVLPEDSIRVLLSSDEGTDLQVFAAAGLKVRDVAAGALTTLPSGPTRWRVVPTGAGLQLQSLTGSTWSSYGAASAGPLRFGGTTFVRVVFPGGSSRDYRGGVQAVRTSATRLQSVVLLSLEDYLLGVVPRESSASWQPAALQAQAIAARSYSANKRGRVAGSGSYDICDTTACQVFGGSRLYSSTGSVTELEPASTSAAVRATAGVVRTYGGTPIFAEFSSSNGGWSSAGNVPYLSARRDDWDGVATNTVHSWKAALRATDLERAFPAVGTLQRLRVTARDGNGEWGGRVKSVVLEGTDSRGAATSVTTTGSGVYNARSWPASSDGLKSIWWHVAQAGSTQDSQVVSQSAAPSLVRPPGESTGSLDVTLRNTGTAAWPVQGLHLAVASPPGQADPLVSGSARPGRYVGNTTSPGAASVRPGEVAAFTFALDAEGVAVGNHGRAYRLRVGSEPLFGATVSFSVPVRDALLTAEQAALPTSTSPASSGGAPAVFADGRSVVLPRHGATTVRLTLRNTGTVAWPVGAGSPVVLGTASPRNRNSTAAGGEWVSASRAGRLVAASDGSSTVPPGETGVVDLVLHGNGLPVGTTAEAFEPLWSGAGWLDGALRTLNVTRVDPAVSRAAALHAGPGKETALGGSSTVLVRLRNLGGGAWTVGAERLESTAGAFPLASGWTTRPPALAANAVRPGARTVEPGEIGEWRVPITSSGRATGRYPLSLQAVSGSARYGPVITTTVVVSGATTAPAAASTRRSSVFKGAGPRAVVG